MIVVVDGVSVPHPRPRPRLRADTRAGPRRRRPSVGRGAAEGDVIPLVIHWTRSYPQRRALSCILLPVAYIVLPAACITVHLTASSVHYHASYCQRRALPCILLPVLCITMHLTASGVHYLASYCQWRALSFILIQPLECIRLSVACITVQYRASYCQWREVYSTVKYAVQLCQMCISAFLLTFTPKSSIED